MLSSWHTGGAAALGSCCCPCSWYHGSLLLIAGVNTRWAREEPSQVGPAEEYPVCPSEALLSPPLTEQAATSETYHKADTYTHSHTYMYFLTTFFDEVADDVPRTSELFSRSLLRANKRKCLMSWLTVCSLL